MRYTWLVEKYLEGELSGEALRKFELEILRKPEVAEEVERVRSMSHFMQEQHGKMQDSIGLIEDFDDIENIVDIDEIRQDLDGLKVRKIGTEPDDVIDIKTKLTESRVSQTLINQRSNKILVKKVSIFLAAASVTILLAISSITLIGKNGPVDHISAFNQFYMALEADEILRSLGEESDNTYLTALQKYNEKDYKTAYQLFLSIPKEAVHNENQFLYQGISAMELGDFQAAIGLFEEIRQNPVLKHSGMWYQGLCHLAMEDYPEAENVFKEIIATNGHYKNKAKQLLRSI